MLPAEDRYDLTFEPPRPPGPSRGRLAFGDPTGRAGTGAPDAATTLEFALPYEFDGKVAFRHAQTLQRILDTARARNASLIRITGYRSASKLTSGEVMRERAGLDRERAEQIRELLSGAGLDAVKYEVRWLDRSKRPDGRNDVVNRRVDVTIVAPR
jgi:hypothetical protein